MCDQNSTYGLALTHGGCQIGYMCDQNSTYGLHSLPGGGVRLVQEYQGCLIGYRGVRLVQVTG
jgi:hypothetical protein